MCLSEEERNSSLLFFVKLDLKNNNIIIQKKRFCLKQERVNAFLFLGCGSPVGAIHRMCTERVGLFLFCYGDLCDGSFCYT